MIFRKKRYAAAFIFFLGCMYHTSAGQQLNSAEIYREIQKLNQFGSVLYIAAHPDDENTRVISYLSKGMHYRTAYLSLTRGDGGQNLIGAEQGEELGLIRTRELIEARKVDGAEQFFTRAYDFGYSKTPEETFAIWNKEEVLRDVVWVIRKFRPDIIISRFPDTGEGGHGHHTASATLAKEAFHAAADPEKFPEQLGKVSVWQTKRLLWNTFNFGGNNTTSSDQFQLNVGTFEPLLGKSYGEIASQSRSKHSSQGFGTPLNRKDIIEYFRTWEGTEPKYSLMDGVDTSWSKCINNPKRAARLTKMVNTALAQFDFTAPHKSIPALLAIHKELLNYPEAHNPEFAFWTEQKLKDINQLLQQCAGVYCEITTDRQNLVAGDTVRLTFSVVSRIPQNKGFKVDLSMSPLKMSRHINTNHWDTVLYFVMPDMLNYDLSHPYWLREPKSKGLFSDTNPMLGLAENPNPFFASFRLHFTDPSFSIFIEPHWQYKYTDPSSGEVYQPVFAVPPAVAIPQQEKNFFLLPDSKEDVEQTINVKVKSHINNFNGKLLTELPEGWQLLTPQSNLNIIIHHAEGEKNISLKVRLPASEAKKLLQNSDYNAPVRFYIEHKGIRYNRSEKRVEYPHIPNQILLPVSQTELTLIPVNKDIITKTGRVGYISGSGDKVMECLKAIGTDIREVSEEELNNPTLLSQYNTIVTGIRAFNTRPELKAQHPNLMEFVKNGGRLVVQYNTNNRIAPLDFDIAPYPLTLSRDRITDEEADVTLLVPEHSLLQIPYVIEPQDFNNWVQERGVYFAGKRDPNFISLLSMADPNEEALDGSLVFAQYGKGSFVYTGLSFFRQLPAGNAGAYRLFINLIYNPL